jgi:hypothetical protein
VSEKEELKQFMKDVIHIMNYVISNYIRNNLNELEMPDFLYKDYLQNAWNEAMRILTEDKINNEIDAIQEDVLSQHGLTGPQLEWKLAVYYNIKDSFIRNQNKRFLTKLIDAIDGVLDSLSRICGVFGAIKEIKDSLRPFLH